MASGENTFPTCFILNSLFLVTYFLLQQIQKSIDTHGNHTENHNAEDHHIKFKYLMYIVIILNIQNRTRKIEC